MDEDIKTDCLNRWNVSDPMINSFSLNFNEWMSQFPEDLKSIIRGLLKHFEYYSHQRVNSYAKQNLNALLDEIDFDGKEVVFSPLKFTAKGPDSSINLLHEFLLINDLIAEKWCQDIVQQKKFLNSAKIIVVVDDICGSGTSIISFMKDNADLLKDKDLVYIVCHLMKNARIKIEDSAKSLQIRLHVICQQVYEKGFSLISLEPPIDNHKKLFCDFSEKVGIPGKYVLGFEDSESLVSFFHDTPNDTMGIFWYEHSQTEPIFPGKEFRPKFNTLQAMQEKRALHKKMNYGAIKEKNKSDR